MDEIEQEIQKLQKEYILSLHQKQDVLQAAFRAEDQKSLKSLCHKMAGSAGTYGLGAMSKALRFMEDYIESLESSPMNRSHNRIALDPEKVALWNVIVGQMVKSYEGLLKSRKQAFSEGFLKTEEALGSLWEAGSHQLSPKKRTKRAA